jgi:UDP-glucose 4-epimerase
LRVSVLYRGGVCSFDGVKILGVNLYMILVTGSAGFIGSHLVERLRELGHSVVGVDLLPGEYQFDICNKVSLDRLFEKECPDLVFHLAANTNVPLSVEDPIFDFRSLQGALNVIDKRVPIIFVSSSFVYGNTPNRPTRELEPFHLSAPYGIVKHTIENYLQFYGEVYGLKYAILRPATVYGPRQVKGAMADYIGKILEGGSAEIYGQKTRDYVYISDVIDALILLMEHLDGEVYNIGTGVETSLNRLYEMLGGTNPILKEGRDGEVVNQSLDCTKLRKLGWKPKVSLEEGLKRTTDAKRKTKKN